MCVIFSDVGPFESILRLALTFQCLLMQFKYHNDYLIGDNSVTWLIFRLICMGNYF